MFRTIKTSTTTMSPRRGICRPGELLHSKWVICFGHGKRSSCAATRDQNCHSAVVITSEQTPSASRHLETNKSNNGIKGNNKEHHQQGRRASLPWPLASITQSPVALRSMAHQKNSLLHLPPWALLTDHCCRDEEPLEHGLVSFGRWDVLSF
jgi:hypothetical protein